MRETELKTIWQNANKTETMNIDMHLDEITGLKTRFALGRLKPVKYFGLILGTLWVILAGSFLIHQFIMYGSQAGIFLLISLGLQVALTAFALIVYIYQLVLVNQLDYSGPVLNIQKQLLKLKASTINVTRIMVLQLPLWSTFYLPNDFFIHANILFLLIQCSVSILLSILAIWIFIQLKIENSHNFWFRLFFNGNEWKPITKARDQVDEMQGCNIQSRN